MDRQLSEKEWSFSQSVEAMYREDSAFVKRYLNSSQCFIHQLDDDALEPRHNRDRCMDLNSHYPSYGGKNLIKFMAECRRSRRKKLECTKLKVSLNFEMYLEWLEKNQLGIKEIPPNLIFKNPPKLKFQPFALLHIAAAQAIPLLKHCDPDILMGVYNATKHKDLFIRHGEETKRKAHLFSNMVKHYIYKGLQKPPLVESLYFELIEVNPKPFCVKCGLIRKIEDAFDKFFDFQHDYKCHLCKILQNALKYTPIVEKSYHVNYIN